MDKDENVARTNRWILGLDAEAEQIIRAIARDEIDKRLAELHLAPIDLTSKLDR